MIFEYEFGDGDEFEYEISFKEEREALVKILCQGLKDCVGKALYSEDGAEQMANYVVYQLDFIDELEEYFEDELKDYFYDEAEREYWDMIEGGNPENDWYGTKSNVLGF